jgi:hypothetical protein
VRITDLAPQEADATPPSLGADIDAISAIRCNVAEICNGLDDDHDGQVDNIDDAECNDGNDCTDDSCSGLAGCIHTDNSAACDDGNACTAGDVCGGGVCVAGQAIVCVASDSCHLAGVCDPATGACSNPNQPNGTNCTDGDLCTTGDACLDGSCTPSFSGLDEPNPRNSGYYKRLCRGPHSGDELSDGDALCVGQMTTTFSGVSTVAEICAVLAPSQPDNDPCGRSEDSLMTLALNVCRARACTAQSIDSQCGGNANVGQSLAEADAIVSSPSRDDDTCSHARCLADEINTGRALEMNSLILRLEGSDVRLVWDPPYLDDGSGHPTHYNVWRRVLGSIEPFSKIGETTAPTFVDTAPGSAAFEYEITAVMN